MPIAGGLSLLADRNPTLAELPVAAENNSRAAPLAVTLDARLPDGAPTTSKTAPPLDNVHEAIIELSVVIEPTAALPAESEATIATEPAALYAPTVDAAITATAPLADAPDPAPTALAAALPASPPVETSPAIAAPAAAAPSREASATTAPAPSRYATIAELEAALAETPWPAELWPQIVRIAQCESGGDTNRDGYKDVVDTQARGAGGLYIGVMQIGRDHRFSVAYDLYSLRGNLLAAHELWMRAGQSFSPWGCK